MLNCFRPLLGRILGTVIALAVGVGPVTRTLSGQTGPVTPPQTASRVHLGVPDSQAEQWPVRVDAGKPLGDVGTAPTAASPADTSVQRRSEFIFATVPISSEAIGIGLAPVAAYVFYPSASDRVSPPSTLAVAGVLTSTRTYGLGLAGMLNLHRDRYRLTFLIGGARARYQFFGIGSAAGGSGNPLWLSQRGHALFFQGLRRIKWNIFGGLRFSKRQIIAGDETLLQNLPPEMGPIRDQLNWSITTAALGLRVQRDTRNDMFYPTKGSRIDGRADFFGPYVGSRFSFQSYQFEMNEYLPLSQGHVVALRAMACGVAGEHVPFYELCQFGWMGDLRGYQTGRYRDRAMLATQAEWRIILPKRLGAAVFAGIGEVAPDVAAFNTMDLLPSGGCGLRYNLSKHRRINLRLDVAYSKTGGSWSMGIGEVF